MVQHNRVKIGMIQKPHGLQGFLKVQALTDFAHLRFLEGERCSVYVRGSEMELEIQAVREQGNLLLVQFKGYESVESVQGFRNLYLYLPDGQDRGGLEDGEFYPDELVGMEIFQGGKKIGVVQKLMEGPAHPILSFRSQGEEVLVPFVKEFVLSVNRDERQLEVSSTYAI